MHSLSIEQAQALAFFKENLHLPGGGYHALIVDLSKEYLLPFQKVRSVVKKSQATIEKKIKQDFSTIQDSDLTKEHWLELVQKQLRLLAKENKPIMETLTSHPLYTSIALSIDKGIESNSEREQLKNDLYSLYETEVFKPLSAMLYTSNLFWILSNDLGEMDDDRCVQFSEYHQHLAAINHLRELDKIIN
jgi:hypothetical protein